MEQIKAMLVEVAKDSAFADEVTALIRDGNTAGIITAAGKKGFVFTQADWREYLAWSKNQDFSDRSGKELAAEKLENIVGGGGFINPDKEHCWFHAGSEPEYRDGALRKKCNQFACEAWSFERTGFYLCKCWGEHRCINGWHYAESCDYW